MANATNPLNFSPRCAPSSLFSYLPVQARYRCCIFEDFLQVTLLLIPFFIRYPTIVVFGVIRVSREPPPIRLGADSRSAGRRWSSFPQGINTQRRRLLIPRIYSLAIPYFPFSHLSR